MGTGVVALVAASLLAALAQSRLVVVERDRTEREAERQYLSAMRVTGRTSAALEIEAGLLPDSMTAEDP